MGDRLAGKVCIVTGAGSGIGRASAIRFAEEGARVTAVDIDRDAVEETVRSIGAAAVAVTADVSVAAQVKIYTDATVERWGGSTMERLCMIKGNITPRTMACITIDLDHNIIDGAPAARFIAMLVKMIEKASVLGEEMQDEEKE